MKLIYITVKDFSKGMNDGVVKKILKQIDAIKKANIDVDYIYVDSNDKSIHYVTDTDEIIGYYSGIAGVSKKKIIHKHLKSVLKTVSYDGAYIRFLDGRTDPWHLDILKVLKKHNTKIILEIPTYPYDDEITKFERNIDRCFRGGLKKYIDRAVTYSEHDAIFGMKTIKSKNGVDVDSIKKIQASQDNDAIDIIAVSSFIYYHGYERLLTGLGEYYKKHDKDAKNVLLHMVGDGAEMDYYKQIVADYHIEDKVNFYGFQSGDALDAIYDKADIAVGSLGIYKIGLDTVSSIKTKEYISRGLPIVAGFYEVGLFDENTEFFLNVGNNESYVDISTIIGWYDKIIGKYGDKAKLVDVIRQYAYDNVDMSIVMKPVVDYLSE